jgi:anti-anti-sigma regulatory factor
MNEGTRPTKSTIEGFAIGEGVVCLKLSGTLSHVRVAPIIAWIEKTIHEEKYRALVIDCTSLDALEPGVAGRLIAHCRSNRLLFEHTVIVTRSAGLIAIARAAAVVLDEMSARVDTAPSLGEALAKISAVLASRVGPRFKRERQASGELLKPGSVVAALAESKRSAG